jgi:hypothetical protein
MYPGDATGASCPNDGRRPVAFRGAPRVGSLHTKSMRFLHLRLPRRRPATRAGADVHATAF